MYTVIGNQAKLSAWIFQEGLELRSSHKSDRYMETLMALLAEQIVKSLWVIKGTIIWLRFIKWESYLIACWFDSKSEGVVCRDYPANDQEEMLGKQYANHYRWVFLTNIKSSFLVGNKSKLSVWKCQEGPEIKFTQPDSSPETLWCDTATENRSLNPSEMLKN